MANSTFGLLRRAPGRAYIIAMAAVSIIYIFASLSSWENHPSYASTMYSGLSQFTIPFGLAIGVYSVLGAELEGLSLLQRLGKKSRFKVLANGPGTTLLFILLLLLVLAGAVCYFGANGTDISGIRWLLWLHTVLISVSSMALGLVFGKLLVVFVKSWTHAAVHGMAAGAGIATYFIMIGGLAYFPPRAADLLSPVLGAQVLPPWEQVATQVILLQSLAALAVGCGSVALIIVNRKGVRCGIAVLVIGATTSVAATLLTVPNSITARSPEDRVTCSGESTRVCVWTEDGSPRLLDQASKKGYEGLPAQIAPRWITQPGTVESSEVSPILWIESLPLSESEAALYIADQLLSTHCDFSVAIGNAKIRRLRAWIAVRAGATMRKDDEDFVQAAQWLPGTASGGLPPEAEAAISVLRSGCSEK